MLLRCVRLNFTHNEIPINVTANRRLGKFGNDVGRTIGKAVSIRHGPVSIFCEQLLFTYLQ